VGVVLLIGTGNSSVEYGKFENAEDVAAVGPVEGLAVGLSDP